MNADASRRPMLGRRVVRDMLPCDQVDSIMATLGWVPSSPDVDQIEHMESHARLSQTAPLITPITHLAQACAGVVCAASAQHPDFPGVGTPECAAEIQRHAALINVTATVVVANLLDAGLLRLGSAS